MNSINIPVSTQVSRRGKGHPYYIYAPPYRETSAGIVVLHTLCHLLNREGYEAYIAGTDVVNPKFDTPVARPDVLVAHKLQGRTPIAVYPEVVSGNPLNAEVCVRYILNRIGRISGKPLNEGKDDLFFYYSENFLGDAKKAEVDFLFLPILDTELFKPDPSRKKDRSFVFQYRFPLDKIDFSLFPAGTELMSMANPVSLPELATKLQAGRVLYSYEVTAVCAQAMACGCPVIYMHDGGLKDLPEQFMFGINGAAMVSEKNGLARAAATVGSVYPASVALSNIFWAQLPVFLEKSQNAARKAQSAARGSQGSQPIEPKRRIAAVSAEPDTHRWPAVRIAKPFGQLENYWDICWPVQDSTNVSNMDVLLIQSSLPMFASQEQLDSLFATGKPVVYETSEPCHDLPVDHPLHFLSKGTAAKVESVMRRATALLVTTPALAERLRPWNANIHVVPTHVDLDLFYSPVREQGGTVRIGVMGSAAKPRNFALVEPALNAIRARFADNVQFVFVGTLPPADWMTRADVTVTGIAQSYEEHAAAFRQLELDIGLMPLAGSEADDGATRLEWLEYSAAGVATIGSDHAAYNELVTHGGNGLRIPSNSTDAWIDAIARLIEDPAYRRGLARTAQLAVVKHASLQSQIARYHEFFVRCAGGNPGSMPEVARIPAVLILDAEGDSQRVQQSLTRHAQGPCSDHMVVVLTTQEGALPEWSDDLRYVQATASEYPGALEQLCAHTDFDWKVITEAGVA
ncbi:glycosyltransferase family 4 protein [Paraburkholderia dinghuensis]|uniref:Glycosyltransferase n=1 Tax=Paraburkholderia dinghuensis TaxID=2305225 RepID=A0A3N6MQR2_9BURK|nr:glycosyltransferase family 4 protein [Paraburkholderia dinghuensis]RQH06068.1 glycosyltransferase [Paraburkholderia dinghuensis]